MKQISSLMFALSLLVLTGCSAVYSVNPVGEKPLAIEADEWNGTWRGGGDAVSIKVTDGEKGILQMAWIENMEFNLFQARLLESNTWVFVNFKEKVDDDGYLWARINKSGNSITMWDPDVDKIRALVTDGTLPGTVKGSDEGVAGNGNVVLGELTAEHLKILTSDDKGILLDWENPIFLQRLSE